MVIKPSTLKGYVRMMIRLVELFTVFDLSDVSNHNLSHGDLDHLAFTDNGELLLLLDATLEPAELLLFGPVVEGRHQHHDDDREQNGSAFDPSSLSFALVLHATRNLTARCKETAASVIKGAYNQNRQAPPTSMTPPLLPSSAYEIMLKLCYVFFHFLPSHLKMGRT